MNDMMTNEMIPITIIEDSEIHAAWLQETLTEDPRFQIIDWSTTGKAGIEAVKQLNPHLVFLDFQLSDLTGIEIAKRIKSHLPHIKIFMLTAINNLVIIERLIDDKNIDALGIKGSPYLEDHLRLATNHVLAGGHYIDSSLLNKLREANTMPGVRSLTKREFEIFIQLMLGKPDHMIADHLSIDILHVKNMKSKILKKIQHDNTDRLMSMLMNNMSKV